MAATCSKCNTSQKDKKPIVCDICQCQLCKACFGITASEEKCAGLGDRKVRLYCPDCILKNQEWEELAQSNKDPVNEVITLKKRLEAYEVIGPPRIDLKNEIMRTVSDAIGTNIADLIKSEIFEVLREPFQNQIAETIEKTIKSELKQNMLWSSTNTNTENSKEIILLKNEVKELKNRIENITSIIEKNGLHFNEDIKKAHTTVRTEANLSGYNVRPIGGQDPAQLEPANIRRNHGASGKKKEKSVKNIKNTPSGHKFRSLEVEQAISNAIQHNEKINIIGQNDTGASSIEKETTSKVNSFQRIQSTKKNHRKSRGNGEAVNGFCGQEKKIWMYVFRVQRNTSSDSILNYLKQKSKSSEKGKFSVKELPTKEYQNKCFMVGAPMDARDEMYSESFWPPNVGYRRFDFNLYHSLNKCSDQEQSGFL